MAKTKSKKTKSNKINTKEYGKVDYNKDTDKLFKDFWDGATPEEMEKFFTPKPKKPFLESFYSLRDFLVLTALAIFAIGLLYDDGLMITLGISIFFLWSMIVSDFLHYFKEDK